MQITDTRTARFNMIEQQIRPWNVLDTAILDTLSLVPREDFVPAEHRALAFADMEIPLAHGQSMLAPKVEARLLQDLQIQPTDSVLEIGTGSGYMAALLGHRAHQVVTLEIVPELADAAHAALRRAGVRNVEVRLADASALAEMECSLAQGPHLQQLPPLPLSSAAALPPCGHEGRHPSHGRRNHRRDLLSLCS
jgi:protein-L-isoaspartate(D-aspartate) O-methyltransferase